MNTALAAFANGTTVSVPLVAAVWLTLRFSRRWLNATTRYGIWWMVLAIVVLSPLFYLPYHPQPVREPSAVKSALIPSLAQPAGEPVSAPSSVLAPIPYTAPALPRFPLRIPAGVWTRYIVAAWACTALLMCLRLIVSYAVLQRRARHAAETREPLTASVRESLLRAGVRRRVRVAIVEGAASPMVMGPLHPAILIPAPLVAALDQAEIEQVCLHEAAHLARFDDCELILQRLVEACFSLHPLVRWITRQLDLEREIACDDFVISLTGQARPYASCLTHVAELAHGCSTSPLAAAATDERSHLTRRVDMLLDKTRRTEACLLKTPFAATATAVLLVAAIAAQSPHLFAFAAAAAPVKSAPAPVLLAQAQPQTRPAAPAPVAIAAPVPIAVAVAVTDPLGRFVTGLDQHVFEVFEDGNQQKISQFTGDDQPVSICIVWNVKASGRPSQQASLLMQDLDRMKLIYLENHPEIQSVRKKLEILAQTEAAQTSGQELLNFMTAHGPRDQFSLIQVNGDLTNALRSAAAQMRSAAIDRKAIFVVSERDENPAGSREELNAALRETGTPIYLIGLGEGLTVPGTASELTAPMLVAQAADQSGGLHVQVASQADLPGAVSRLAIQLRNVYVLNYASSNPTHDGRYRRIEIRVTTPRGLPELKAQARKGYFVPDR